MVYITLLEASKRFNPCRLPRAGKSVALGSCRMEDGIVGWEDGTPRRAEHAGSAQRDKGIPKRAGERLAVPRGCSRAQVLLLVAPAALQAPRPPSTCRSLRKHHCKELTLSDRSSAASQKCTFFLSQIDKEQKCYQSRQLWAQGDVPPGAATKPPCQNMDKNPAVVVLPSANIRPCRYL